MNLIVRINESYFYLYILYKKFYLICMLCQARKKDGSLCNNLAYRGSKTCHIETHRKQFIHIQNGG
jgi:hypothetical protein